MAAAACYRAPADALTESHNQLLEHWNEVSTRSEIREGWLTIYASINRLLELPFVHHRHSYIQPHIDR